MAEAMNHNLEGLKMIHDLIYIELKTGYIDEYLSLIGEKQLPLNLLK